MGDTLSAEPRGVVTLPPNAPKVRITAGLGTVHQKTWNLRRPVTLIGASRLSHIALSEETVSRAHCLIVNTGQWVLLKDLHSTNGTHCNDRPVDLVVLSDGDVLQLGETTIQIAMQAIDANPGATRTGTTYHDPLALREPVVLHRAGSTEQWSADRAVTIIGRRPGVSIRLEHPDVSQVHAALMRIGDIPAVFDLNSVTGTWVDDQRAALAPLSAGAKVKVGPFELVVAKTVKAPAATHAGATNHAPELGVRVGRLLKMEDQVKTSARELERREEHLEREQAAVDAARIAIENDRRALEQQALALRNARAQLDGERALREHAVAGAVVNPPSTAPIVGLVHAEPRPTDTTRPNPIQADMVI